MIDMCHSFLHALEILSIMPDELPFGGVNIGCELMAPLGNLTQQTRCLVGALLIVIELEQALGLRSKYFSQFSPRLSQTRVGVLRRPLIV